MEKGISDGRRRSPISLRFYGNQALSIPKIFQSRFALILCILSFICFYLFVITSSNLCFYTKGKEALEMPSWMSCLQKKMFSNETSTNVKLFIIKLIINTPKVHCFFIILLLICSFSSRIAGQNCSSYLSPGGGTSMCP